MRLPKKLGKEPLVEALFNMRFKSSVPVASVFPGLVFANFSGEKKIETLPVSELPQALLASDPNLKYAPHVRIHWETFLILCGNQSVGVACKLPYPGWTAGFKPAILKVVKLLEEAKFVDAVERFSLRYTNLIPAQIGVVSSVVDFTLKIGSHDAARSLFQIRAELPQGNMVSIVQLAAEGVTRFEDGATRTGMPIDIDTIVSAEMPFPAFLSGLPDAVEVIHNEVKSIFFDCLKPEALAKLEPVYE
jgi:uncharacterized protein (TIGR04255 family)